MKSIDGRAQGVVGKTVEECFELVADVERYPRWTGEIVREVEVLEWGSGRRPALARIKLHVAQSPLNKDFEFHAAIETRPPGIVLITRRPNETSDREKLELEWHLSEADGTQIELQFRAATPLLPSFAPLFGVGDEIAQTILGCAVVALG